MGSDTVTPDRDPLGLRERGRNTGDPTLEAWGLIQRLGEVGENLFTDGIWGDFRTSDDTRSEMARAVTLLAEVEQIVERCIAREEPLAEPFYQAFTAAEERSRLGVQS